MHAHSNQLEPGDIAAHIEEIRAALYELVGTPVIGDNRVVTHHKGGSRPWVGVIVGPRVAYARIKAKRALVELLAQIGHATITGDTTTMLELYPAVLAAQEHLWETIDTDNHTATRADLEDDPAMAFALGVVA